MPSAISDFLLQKAAELKDWGFLVTPRIGRSHIVSKESFNAACRDTSLLLSSDLGCRLAGNILIGAVFDLQLQVCLKL